MAETEFTQRPLLGVGGGRVRPPNTFSTWQYVLIALVLVLGCLYAAPNIFQPDPAIQIRPSSTSEPVTATQLDELAAIVRDANIQVLGTELNAGAGLIRVDNDDNQLKARALIVAALAQNDNQYTVALNRASTTPQWLRDIGGKPMSLGLDLSGGVHFLLQVDMDRYLAKVVESAASGMQDTLREERIRYARNREWVDGRVISIGFDDAATRDLAREALEADYVDYQVREELVGGNPGLVYRLSSEKIQQLEDRAISQNLTSLRNRVNELGVSEPQVQRLGRSRIVVDLPGIQDSARAKDILNKFANLEFRLAAEPNTPRFQRETYPYEGRMQDILRRTIVTGNNVQDAQQAFDQETSGPIVLIELDNEGGNRMHDATKDNIGRPMAILFIEQKPIVRKVVENGEEKTVFETEEEQASDFRRHDSWGVGLPV